MPRDGSGNYTLPAGNPVVDGTIIDVVWANPTMQDIAVQLNNVITRDGVLGFTNAVKIIDGTLASPGLQFASETNTGLARLNPQSLAIVVNGIERTRFISTGENVTGVLSVSGQIKATYGSNSVPSYSFTDLPNWGMSLSGSGIGFSINGAYRFLIDPTVITIPSGMNLNVGQNISATGNITGTLITGTTIASNNWFRGADTSAADPTFSFTSEPNMGMYRSQPTEIGFAVSGALKFGIHGTGVRILGVATIDGNITAPTGTITTFTSANINATNETKSFYFLARADHTPFVYSFNGDTTSGMSRANGSPGVSFWDSNVAAATIKNGLASFNGAVNAVGSFTGGNEINVVGNSVSNAWLWRSDGNFQLANSGTTRMLNFGSNYGWRWNSTNGDLAWISSGVETMTVQQAGGNLLWRTGTAAKPGGGSWVDVSDETFKDNITNFNRGMNLIRFLNPKRYSFKAETGRDPTKIYIGLIAQDVETRLPEVVSTFPVSAAFPNYTGPITETKLLDTSFLVYVLINACQELDQRIELLENA